MNQHKLNFIREKCIEANPEIKRLPDYPYNPDAAKAIKALDLLAGKQLWSPVLEETASMLIGKYEEQKRANYVAMLQGRYEGRPIRLADVLLAIDGAHANLYGGIRNDGQFIVDLGEHTAWAPDGLAPILWNLRAADLREQSEETINFLCDLLK